MGNVVYLGVINFDAISPSTFIFKQINISSYYLFSYIIIYLHYSYELFFSPCNFVILEKNFKNYNQ